MKRIVTSEDIYRARLDGVRSVSIGPSDTVTDEARDAARRLGIEILLLPEKGPAAGDGETGGAEHRTRDRPNVAGPRLDLVVKGGYCVLPGGQILRADVGIRNGTIQAVGGELSGLADHVVEAGGKYVIPGVVDPHVHFGIYGPFEEEVRSETLAALVGGVTTCGCFIGGQKSHFETYPLADKVLRKNSHVSYKIHLVISTEQQLAEIPRYVYELGVDTFKVYMSGVPGVVPDADDGFIADVLSTLARIQDRSVTLMVHAENASMVRRSSWKFTGTNGSALKVWALTHPSVAEEEAVRRILFLSEKYGVSLYLVHISSAESLVHIAESKRRGGIRLWAETTSPYLTVDTDSAAGLRAKMVPPVRDRKNRDALWRGLEDGTLDTVATDNVSLTMAQKVQGSGSVWDALPGYPALATHLVSMVHEGVRNRGLGLSRLVQVMCENPARALGLYPQKGAIAPGSDGDLVVLDLETEREVRAEDFPSRGDFTLFDGQRMVGWPVATIARGKLLVKDLKYVGGSG